MNPPSVVEVTIPSNHRISKITKIVQSICMTFQSRFAMSLLIIPQPPAAVLCSNFCCVFFVFNSTATSSAEATTDPLCIRCQLLQPGNAP